MIRESTRQILQHLAVRPGHDEVKAGIRELLVEEFGVHRDDLEFERRVPEVRGRLDALIGRTVFEVKSNLDKEWADVERRMPDYLADRERELGERFVGIATDGAKWSAFELSDGQLVRIKDTVLDQDRPEAFLVWLDGVVALKSSLLPDPMTIRAELGQDSIAYRRASAELLSLWEKLKDEKATALKHALWASLLKLVYGREIEGRALWIQHSFLVIVAKAIALAVLDVQEDDPARVLSGQAFATANIVGAVESDFFDWVIGAPEGVALVRRIMTHVRRFRLREVKSDVLKVLYESLIDRDERHGLGEYYTPDWLAAKVVRHAVDRPLEQRVLDPACGSGTFLFHAVRRVLSESEDAGMVMGQRAGEATKLVAGMDIHPVAVIIARVTYLLALAPVLNGRAGTLSIPVYLGDAMQLSISEMIGGKELTIRVPPPPAGNGDSGAVTKNGGERLDFPETFCRDPSLFDKALENMRKGSAQELTRAQIEAGITQITREHYRRDISDEERHAISDLGKTYVTFDRLRREGRDTVWAYVARNLSRPLAYAAAGGWANIIVGNPPWVSFRHMSEDLQKRFRSLAVGERVYVGGKLATQNDLCALFTVRAASIYLRAAGKIAFVLPLAALTRGQFERFRSGAFESTRLAFDEAWVMDDDLKPLFPVPSCVIFARKRALAQRLPDYVRRFSGSLPIRDASEALADAHLAVEPRSPRPSEAILAGGSIYRSAFRQGATLVPRMLCLVERRRLGSFLGSDPEAPFVASRRSPIEKRPWREAPGIEGRVEAAFLRPALLGESILPYRVWHPFEAVVPVTETGEVIDAQGAANRGISGLFGWMREAEVTWGAHSQSGAMTLIGRWNYHNELGTQFPIAPIRVVYAKSGTIPAATLVRDNRAVIDHMLYWFAPTTEEEGLYLSALLNSETARSRTAQLQSRGQWGARHFDKVIFTLSIPRFDGASGLHVDIAAAASESERLAARVTIPPSMKFQRARREVREALTEAGISSRTEHLVSRLLEQ